MVLGKLLILLLMQIYYVRSGYSKRNWIKMVVLVVIVLVWFAKDILKLMESIMMLFSHRLFDILRMITKHLDVPKAFSNADIDYDCYMAAPVGTKLPPGKCYKLLKSLYGLKQAARLWNKLLTSFLLSIEMTQCMSDTCLFYSANDANLTIVCFYVDDILIVSTSDTVMDDIASKLHARFNTTDMGILSGSWVCEFILLLIERQFSCLMRIMCKIFWIVLKQITSVAVLFLCILI